MAKRKISKSSKRRLIILVPIVVFLVGYAAFTLVTTVLEMYNLNKEETNLKTNLNDLKGEAEDLKTEIDKLQDKDYIARYARENYLYTKDGEYVIKVDDEKKKEKNDNFNINTNYIFYGSGILIGLIVIYIFCRHRKKKPR